MNVMKLTFITVAADAAGSGNNNNNIKQQTYKRTVENMHVD